MAAPLTSYLEEHVDEELHHDETLLDDLEILGVDRTNVAERMPTPTVAALVGSRTTGPSTTTPSPFLGYVALMEGYPPTPELIETLIAKTGYPREAFRTYIEHAELDPGHRDHLDRTVDSLPLPGGTSRRLAFPRSRPPVSRRARSRNCSTASRIAA